MAAPAGKTLRDYADEASTLADLVAAIEGHQRGLEELAAEEWGAPPCLENEQALNMHVTALAVLLGEAKRISRELEERLDVLATKMGKSEAA